MSALKSMLEQIRQFRDQRDWMQFHNPKDMAAALSIEAAELMEIFLWKTEPEAQETVLAKRERIEEEIADIGLYLFELADNLDIDLLTAMKSKLEKNAAKYPVEKAKGRHTKYTEL